MPYLYARAIYIDKLYFPKVHSQLNRKPYVHVIYENSNGGINNRPKDLCAHEICAVSCAEILFYFTIR